ncbi:AraC family transcriptional regulator [Prolixibacteraceae bacterium JC049]|nr:AraC family transcriptional regulator [Prolixibacteraceae bacterium JC049]
MLHIETYQPEFFSDLIERIWIAENLDDDTELVIPPNQYVNLIFPLGNSKYKRNHTWIDTPQIEGLSIENTVLTYPTNTQLLGLRFYAFGLFPFIQANGKDLINNSQNYSPNSQQAKATIDLSASDSNTTIIDKVYGILKTLYCQESYDKITSIMSFYNQFRWLDDNHSIEEYCSNSGTNYTTLNRNFTKVIGITPKKFERLIKFRKSLCSLIDSNDKLTSIGINSGYFDQAHFIREFKMFLNETPSNYKRIIQQADKESKIINYNFKLF